MAESAYDLVTPGTGGAAVRDSRAERVARNLLQGCRHEPDHKGVAGTALVLPHLALVGLQR